MVFQATVTLLGLAGFLATAALLCALVVMLWAFGARRILSAPANELTPYPFDNVSSTPLTGANMHVQAGPTHLDLGIDFGFFRSQIRHDFEAFQAQIGRQCDLTFQHLGTDFEGFQAQIGRRCDLELDALCESAIDNLSAKFMQDLVDEFGPDCPAGAVGAQARRQPASAEPGVEFEANAELPCGRALEGTCSRVFDEFDGALDCMCAAALRALEDECSDVLGDDA